MNQIINYILNNWIEISGAVFGLIYLYYEYKASFRMWPVGILMSLFYTYVYIETKFYSFALINVYFILAGIYGWTKWRKSKNNNYSTITLLNCPKKKILPICLSIASIFVFLVLILKNYTNSYVVYGDSFVTTLSIVAMWMLAHRYIEQWILLIILNFVSIFIYSDQNLYATAIMYLIYTGGSCLGYINWKNKLKETNSSNEII